LVSELPVENTATALSAHNFILKQSETETENENENETETETFQGLYVLNDPSNIGRPTQ